MSDSQNSHATLPSGQYTAQQIGLGNTIIDQRYRLIHPLGGGGMGSVYKTIDETNNQTVALKLLSSKTSPALLNTLRQRLKREIKVLMLVDDPRIIQLLDWGLDPTHGIFYTMELIEGAVPLDEFLQNNELTLSQIVRILEDLLGGLHSLHEIKVLHRDLKPSNVLCAKNSDNISLKIIDPGIARWMDQEQRLQLTVETAPGKTIGTPYYMPPEMWQGLDPTAQTDIYQVGILAFELLTGTLPFTGNDIHAVIFKHIQDPLPPMQHALHELYALQPGALSQKLEAILSKATAKKPTDRFDSAAAFRNALQACRESLTNTNQAVTSQNNSDKVWEPINLLGLPQQTNSQALSKRNLRALIPTVVLFLLLVSAFCIWLFRASLFGTSSNPTTDHHANPSLTRFPNPTRPTQRPTQSTDLPETPRSPKAATTTQPETSSPKPHEKTPNSSPKVRPHTNPTKRHTSKRTPQRPISKRLPPRNRKKRKRPSRRNIRPQKVTVRTRPKAPWKVQPKRQTPPIEKQRKSPPPRRRSSFNKRPGMWDTLP